MRILVIDDTVKQREHAQKTLSAEHEVVTADGWESGQRAIKKGGWDMVLTDLMMPGEPEGVRGSGIGEPTSYGFILALLALKSGVPRVAVVTSNYGSDDHHASPILWAVDCLSDEKEVIRGLWFFTGYSCLVPECSGVLKAWKEIVQKIS